MPMVKNILFFFFLASLTITVSAQETKVKDYVIAGNQNYMSGNFSKAEAQYKTALSEDLNSIKANYNLGNSLYRQKRYDEARTHYDRVIRQKNSTKAEKQMAYHNIGKSYLDENNPEKAVVNFKEALKLNPYDEETRYNYALARKLLEKKQNEDEKNKNDSGKDDKDKKDNQQNQDKEKQDGQQGQDDNNKGNKPDENKGNQQNGGQDGNDEGNGDKPQQQQITKGSDGNGDQSPNAMNAEYQEGILRALQNQEQETLKKIISQKAQKVRTNTEKDW